jgi:hypothetical protein
VWSPHASRPYKPDHDHEGNYEADHNFHRVMLLPRIVEKQSDRSAARVRRKAARPRPRRMGTGDNLVTPSRERESRSRERFRGTGAARG